MSTHRPDWTAPRTGHDWTDPETLAAVNWLKSFVPSAEMERRLETAKANVLAAHREWQHGRRPSKFDAKDAIAWQLLQAETYATDRKYFVPDDISLIAPIMQTIGKHLALLRTIPGADDRASRLVNSERAQPDGGLYEFLVALAYSHRGWTSVRFVPEVPGVRKTPDILVSKPRSSWAVECKRMQVPRYVSGERKHAERLFAPIHATNTAIRRSMVVTIHFRAELQDLPDDYVSERVEAAIRFPRGAWSDDGSKGMVVPIDWRLCRQVLAKDDVYFGASRMSELLVGRYDHQLEHSLSGTWTPARERPLYASTLHQATVFRWTSRSAEASRAKAKHFRSVVANAERQLPADMPGVVHVGTESRSGLLIDAFRNVFNKVEMLDFEPVNSRLRYVYNNVLAPEETTNRNETWAIQETTVPYRVGRHSTKQPLPYHLLLRTGEGERDTVPWQRFV